MMQDMFNDGYNTGIAAARKTYIELKEVEKKVVALEKMVTHCNTVINSSSSYETERVAAQTLLELINNDLSTALKEKAYQEKLLLETLQC